MISEATISALTEPIEISLAEEYREKEQQLALLSEYFLSVDVYDPTKPKRGELIPEPAHKKLMEEIYNVKKRMEYIECLPFATAIKIVQVPVMAVETHKGAQSFFSKPNTLIFEQ